MVMPSDTPTVLNCQPSMFWRSTALLTVWPRSITVRGQYEFTGLMNHLMLSIVSLTVSTEHMIVS